MTFDWQRDAPDHITAEEARHRLDAVHLYGGPPSPFEKRLLLTVVHQAELLSGDTIEIAELKKAEDACYELLDKQNELLDHQRAVILAAAEDHKDQAELLAIAREAIDGLVATGTGFEDFVEARKIARAALNILEAK